MSAFRYVYIGKQGLESIPGLRPDTVKSGNLQYVAYNLETKELRIVFAGGEYSYAAVPQHVFIGLLNDASPGQFFNANVKEVYACQKIESTQVAS